MQAQKNIRDYTKEGYQFKLIPLSKNVKENGRVTNLEEDTKYQILITYQKLLFLFIIFLTMNLKFKRITLLRKRFKKISYLMMLPQIHQENLLMKKIPQMKKPTKSLLPKMNWITFIPMYYKVMHNIRKMKKILFLLTI